MKLTQKNQFHIWQRVLCLCDKLSVIKEHHYVCIFASNFYIKKMVECTHADQRETKRLLGVTCERRKYWIHFRVQRYTNACWWMLKQRAQIYTQFKILQGSHSNWKTWKMGRHFPVREKLGNFEQTGKVRENHTKYGKSQGISDKCDLLIVMIFKWTVC